MLKFVQPSLLLMFQTADRPKFLVELDQDKDAVKQDVGSNISPRLELPRIQWVIAQNPVYFEQCKPKVD